MRLPERIEVAVTVDGKPLEGQFINLTIVTTFKNNFHLLFGATADDGKLVITRNRIISEALRDQELFVMDYGDPESHFSGEIVVSILGKKAIERAIDAYYIFKDAIGFPPDYLGQLHRAHKILAALEGKEISLDVTQWEPGNVSIRVEADQ